MFSKVLFVTVLLSSTIFAAPPARANYVDSDGFLRSYYSEFITKNFPDALRSCPNGYHVPTIRELAIEAQTHGAKGILEKSQVDPRQGPPAGYWLYVFQNVTVSKSGDISTTDDSFYYSREGYQHPANGLPLWKYWSASQEDSYYAVGLFPSDAGIYPMAWHTTWGERDVYPEYAVRCFVNR